jgi:transposase
MSIAHRFIGIDICKAHLDIYDDGTAKCERIANGAAAIAAMLERWPRAGLRVIFEATGSYDRTLRCALEAANIAYVRVNPARARDFARATAALAKTDAIDARLLASMGRALALAPSQAADPLRERLARLQRRRDQLVATRADEKKRLAIAEDDDVRASIAAHIAWIDAEMKRLQVVIDRLVASSAQLLALRKQLQTAPGVGPVTALTLIALMPELGQRSGKTIAALAGLAPFNNDSGAFRGQRHIKGGRGRVRRALYMAAIAAIRKVPRLTAHYRNVVGRSGHAKVGIIAVARKLLVALNAMARTGQPLVPV